MKKRYVCGLGLLLVLLFGERNLLNGQEPDFCTWMKLAITHEVNPKWTLTSNLEWRTKENAATQDRWGVGADAEYEALPFLKVGGGYEVHYRNRGEEEWKFRHRYRVQATFSARLHRF